MERIIIINETCGVGSHGKICLAIAKEYEAKGYEAKIAYGRSGFVPKDAEKYAIRIGTDFSVKLHALYTRLTDRHGFASSCSTKGFLKWLEDYSPTIVWLHNIHGYYINIRLLFEWLQRHPSVEVKWTLHDCWSFTGHCSHFMAIGCEKWKTCCYHCPEKKNYPKSWFLDSSRRNFLEKKALFTSLANIQIIVPSKWLASRVKESFLSKYDVSVRYNEIDKNIFQKRDNSLRERLNLEKRKVVLAVANKWTERKGLLDLIQFSRLLQKDTALIVIGVDKKQKVAFGESAICIERTENQIQLAEFYSMADWFVNFTYEDTYPTVNLEAEACGLKVITYGAGGAPETIHDNGSRVIEVGDFKKAISIINGSAL